MTEAQAAETSFPDLPSHYWSTLTHHGHPSPTKLLLETELVRLSEIHIDASRHDAAYFSDFSKHDRLISPSTRTCSSLLSEMLRPSINSHASSPTMTSVDTMSEHGSCSRRSTPPLQISPRKASTADASDAVATLPSTRKPNDASFVLQAAPRPARHISFGAPVAVNKVAAPEHIATTEYEMDLSGEATPVVNRTLVHPSTTTHLPHGNRSLSADHDKVVDEQQALRPRAIRFAGSSTTQTRSIESSRRSSYSESHIATRLSDEPQSQSSANVSPVLCARAGPATCKSTLEAMLRKEQIAKVIETVPEEEDEDDRDTEEEEEDDEDEDLDDITPLDLDVDSDDDGYQEDVESDEDDLANEEEYAVFGRDLATPTTTRFGKHLRVSSEANQIATPKRSKVYRTAAPSESDLPDTTDFAPGNMDEDQPACIAFDMAIKDREARLRPAKPSDIDPTFPESGTDEDSEQGSVLLSPPRAANGRPLCRSPPARQIAARVRLNSPPLAKMFELQRARSLPRRYLSSRKGLYAPKPQRAVTIKQSNEQRAQRRREKKEIRQNMRRVVKPDVIDHNGHEKMKVHCLSKRRLVAAENPCVIRPVMSI